MIARTSIRVAIRTLGRHRSFTAVAILSLGIAIALNTTMYSIVDAMIRPPISARQPGQVYSLRFATVRRLSLPADVIGRAFDYSSSTFEGVSGLLVAPALAEAEGGTFQRVDAAIVRPNFFALLGTVPLEGRLFNNSDVIGAESAVISDRLARHLFPVSSPVGRILELDGRFYAIVGVVARSTIFPPLTPHVWTLRSPAVRQQAEVPINMIRLRPGMDEKSPAVVSELATVAARLGAEAHAISGEPRFDLRPLPIAQFELGKLHFALIGAVVCVLLIACANLANLQLARGLARARELAVRVAIGASRRQLIAQLLLETSVLAAAGVLSGVALTLWGVYLIEASMPPIVADFLLRPQISWRVFAFAVVAGVLTLVLVGLFPALQISRVDPDTLLKSGAGTGMNRTRRRRYGTMIVAQISCALPVLIGAIVLLRSFWYVGTPDYLRRNHTYGFDPGPIVSLRTGVATASGSAVSLAGAAADVESRVRSFNREVIDVSVTTSRVARGLTIMDDAGLPREFSLVRQVPVVSPSYFRTLRRPIVQGRDFHDGENDGVIVDSGTALFLWQKGSPIGRRIKLGRYRSQERWYRVVGVMRDRESFRRSEYYGFEVGEIVRTIAPADSISSNASAASVRAYARVRGNPELAALRIERLLRDAAGRWVSFATPLTAEYGMPELKGGMRFIASLFTTFAVVGVGLVAIGLFGVVAHSVAERRRELAVRISVGATTRDILRAVLREGVVLLLAGIAVGLLCIKYAVFWLRPYMVLYDDTYNSPLFALLAATLFGVATVAAYMPARRATRIDPVEALRHE